MKFPPELFPEHIHRSADHFSVRSIEGAHQLNPPVPVDEPDCLGCGHGALAHTLMGTGTCSDSVCPCVRFRFAQRP